jgi:hypothetical protein
MRHITTKESPMNQRDDMRDLIQRAAENDEWLDALVELFRAVNRFSRVHAAVGQQEGARRLAAIRAETEQEVR